MQKSITSFFGAPKDGAGAPPSPKKSRPSTSNKPGPKSKAKPKERTKAKPKANPNGRATAADNAAASKDEIKEEGGDHGDSTGTPPTLGSPIKSGAKGTNDGQEGESPSMNASAGKRKASMTEGKDIGGGEKKEGGEVATSVRPKRLRRLAKNVAVEEDSDDEMFGEGDGSGETSAAMNVDDTGDGDGDGDGENKTEQTTVAGALETTRAEDGEGGTVSNGYGKDAKYCKDVGVSEQGVNDESEGGDGGDDDESDNDIEEEEAEEEEEEGGETTVSGALMAGARKAKNAASASKKKVVKGSTASSLVVSKTEDLVAKAIWKKGQPVPFEAVAEMFSRVEQTTKRLEIQEILRGFLCTVITLTPEDLVPCVYLACNQLAPAYEGMELGIGDMVLQKAIQGATGRSAKDVKAAAVKAGDLGEVAQHSTKAQGTLSFGQTIKTLSARDILERYRGIARVKGNMSQEDKITRIKKLLVSCKGLQAKYIIRGLQGKMRIGLSASTVMVSLSHAAVTCPSEAVLASEKAEKALEDEKAAAKVDKSPSKEKEEAGGEGETRVSSEGNAEEEGKGEDKDGLIPVARKLRETETKDLEERLELATQLVKQAYSECPNLDHLIKAILTAPLYRLQQTCRLTPGVPVFPMLAKPTKSIGEVLQRLSGQEFTCEYKYDGVRAQVHRMPDGSLRFFSRNSKDSSSELPDLIPVLKDCTVEGVESFVIDTEVVAYDRDTGNLLPFQMLSTRGRKDVDANDVKVKVIVEAFDILYLNGKSLLQRPLQERRTHLRSTFKEVEGRFRFATFMDHKEDGDTGPIEEFLSEAVKGNCEGLMVKTLTENASYEPSKRSLNWLKLKKDYLQADGGGVGDSLDLVPIGAFFGRGKRTGKYGAYLLACYDPDREEYQSVCKIGTGFTDEILLSFWTELKEHTVEKRPRYYNVADSLAPDVWLAPHKVWEVKCADLSKSPVHKAAVGKLEPDRGISIRFPRLLRERDDKDPEQATTADQILDMYEGQDVVKSNTVGAQAANADDDWEL